MTPIHNDEPNARAEGTSRRTTMGPVTLTSDHLTLTLDPDRGGEITNISAPGRANSLAYYDWHSPLEAGAGPAYGSSQLDWLSKYQAGWQFLFPNSGAESAALGVPVGFHGETSLSPVTRVHTDTTSCTITTYARLPLQLHRTIRLAPDAPTVFIEERVINIGAVDSPFLWGHHPTFPATPGARLDLPGGKFSVEPSATGNLVPQSGDWPTAVTAEGSTVDLSVLPDDQMVRLLYLRDMPAAWAALRNPAGKTQVPGIAMSWDHGAYPALWLWLQNGDEAFPWYGRARMLGIEPQRSWPFDGLSRAIEREQALVARAGEAITSWLTLTLLPDECGPVTGVDRLGKVSYE